jgi:hypothetical protein
MRHPRISAVTTRVGAALAVWVAAANSGSTGVAAAEPDFPDLNDFTAVAADAYTHEVGKGRIPTVEFVTAPGVYCTFYAAVVMPDPTSNQYLRCSGIRDTTVAPDNGMCEFLQVTNNNGMIYSFLHTGGPCDEKSSVPTLLAGQKISNGNITCAAGADELTACLDTRVGQQHGFVLRPTGNIAF